MRNFINIVEVSQANPHRARAEALARWFHGSKCVDEAGRPKRMYHGTGSGDISAFERSKAASNGLYGPGFYFTDSPSVAGADGGASDLEGTDAVAATNATGYAFARAKFQVKKFDWHEVRERIIKGHANATNHDEQVVWGDALSLIQRNPMQFVTWVSGGNVGTIKPPPHWLLHAIGIERERLTKPTVYPVFLRITNPFRMEQAYDFATIDRLIEDTYSFYDDLGLDWQEQEPVLGSDIYLALVKQHGSRVSAWGKREANAILQRNGFDGIQHAGGRNIGTHGAHDVWIAFEPSQIKSVFAREFDPAKPGLSESALPTAFYGYWVMPDGEVIPIDEVQGHQKIAFAHFATEKERAELSGSRLDAFIRKDESYRFTVRALQAGWVRIIEKEHDQSMFVEFRVKLTPPAERATINIVRRSAREVFDYTVAAHGEWEHFDAARNVITFIRGGAEPMTEEVHPGGAYFLHVTSAKNLNSIKNNGLQPNAGGGNYSGYHTSLEGVYATRDPRVIMQHIMVRRISHHYVIAVIRVDTPAFVDEDVLDVLLAQSLDEVVREAGFANLDDMIERLEEDGEDIEATIANMMLPVFKRSLGPARTTKKLDDLLLEFCESWVLEHMGGDGGGDGNWWAETKDQIIRAFPDITHPVVEFGNDWSIRIPGAVGFEGDTRIVAIVEVRNDVRRVIWGTVPPEAQRVINSVV